MRYQLTKPENFIVSGLCKIFWGKSDANTKSTLSIRLFDIGKDSFDKFILGIILVDLAASRLLKNNVSRIGMDIYYLIGVFLLSFPIKLIYNRYLKQYRKEIAITLRALGLQIAILVFYLTKRLWSWFDENN